VRWKYPSILKSYFEELPDFRVKGRCLHELSDIVMLVLCGFIADCEDFEEVEGFGHDKRECLQTFLKLPNGIPSHDAMNRVLRHLDAGALEACLRQWGKEILAGLAYDHLTVDGKELGGTCPKGSKHALNQLVSVWVREAQLTLAQRQIESKQNEIVAIPQVLELIDVEEKVVTIDAIACQHPIVEQIIEQKGDYVIALKANQKEVFGQVKEHFGKYSEQFLVSTQLGKDHHRAEERRYYFSDKVNAMACLGEWRACKSVWMVESKRGYLGKTTIQQRFYLSSLPRASPQQMTRFTRGHWSVENQLHWPLDVSFKEDECRVRRDNAPQNLSVIRKLALQVLRQVPGRISIKRKRKKASRDEVFLATVLQCL
jgi:predicted transposase YbfD/YdcC